MGQCCSCAHPSAVEVEQVDIRARYSIDSPRNVPEPQYWHRHHLSSVRMQQQRAAGPHLNAGISSSHQGFAAQDGAEEGGCLSGAPGDALSPECLLSMCAVLVEEEPDLQAAGIHPLLLAGLSLIESGGRPAAKQHRDHIDDTAVGLCQMLHSTAQWLASSKGFVRYGSSPTASDLEHPKTCLYYCAAYLSCLIQHKGSTRSESFVVKAYHAGPKAVDSSAAAVYWLKYLKAKQCLAQVAKAMCVTLATAAAFVGLPVASTAPAAGGTAPANSQPSEAGRPSPCSGGEAPDVPDSEPLQDVGSSRHTGWPAGAAVGSIADGKVSAGCHPRLWGSSIGSQHRRNLSSGTRHTGEQQLCLPCAAAGLVSVLSSSWEGEDVPAVARHFFHLVTVGAAGSAATLSAPGGDSPSVVSQLLPGIRPVTPRPQQHQQQQTSLSWQNQQQADTTSISSGSYSQRTGSRRRWSGLGSITNSGSTARDTEMSSSTASPHGSSAFVTVNRATTEAALQRLAGIDTELSLAAMPCVMHVVGHGETLGSIAAVCGVATADVLAANPDISDAVVHTNDCIALPVPAVPLQLYVIRQGDSLQSIARAHKVTVGRLLAKNPELADPSRVQPGAKSAAELLNESQPSAVSSTSSRDTADNPRGISTGCTGLDLLLGGGGVACGTVTEFFGVPGVGKTQVG
eukprot:gene5996-6234_t